jgi:Fe-S-cluster containining protein
LKSGFIGEVIQDMENGVLDFTKNGKCSNCGECCSDLLPISVKEIKKIKSYIQKHHIPEQLHSLPLANPQVIDFTCPFRNNAERKCEIYEVRPAICRDFQCDKPKKKIQANKSLYHEKYQAVSMREVFFPTKEVSNT